MTARYVDLHTHTTASDGTDAPEELVAKARAAGLTAIAVTDHDTLGGVGPARAAAGDDLEVVTGVELSVAAPAGQMHLLGYEVEATGPFMQLIEGARAGRGPRNAAIVRRLQGLGIDITVEEVEEEASAGATAKKSVGRPHIAAVLLKKGVVSSVREAFDRFLADGGPAHVPKPKLDPGYAVRAVRQAGGVPVLAHPFSLPPEVRRDVVTRLVDAGLGGIEVWHSRQKPDVREEVAALAKEFDLVQTGGTDYHGTNKPDVTLGSGVDGNVRVTYEVLDAIRARKRA